jgi:GGDEF domain-containing protein
MSLQGPILIVADKPATGLVQALAGAGAFPVIETTWRDASAALVEIKPSAIVASEPPEVEVAAALAQKLAKAAPIIPMVICLPDDKSSPLLDALTMSEAAPAEQLIARLGGLVRLRALHATVIGRARTLKADRNIVSDMPSGDPLDDATVLLVGRGRYHATLSVAVGERMGVMGALSIEAAARCLTARDIDGIVIGDGLPLGAVDAFLTVLAEDSRFRDLPVAVLGGAVANALPNLVCAHDPQLLLERAVPLIRLRTFETALKRLLQSIESKGMLDPHTGLLNNKAFGQELDRAIEDALARGVALSLARFSFDQQIERRASMDAARLMSRLVRSVDFAHRQDDGSILFAFADTDLRSAHVAARRLASVLKHTMLHRDREEARVSPAVTLATLKPTDTALTLLARVAPRPVAAA